MGTIDVGGLYQKFGLEQTVSAAGGEYKTFGDLREIEFDLDLTTLTTTPTIILGTDNIFFPAGARIEEVQIVNKVAATSGGSATLDLGLTRTTDRTTEIDWDGILAVAPLADYNALGERITYTIPSAICGALMTAGTTGANVGHLSANYKTAAYTAGVVTIRIKYRKP